ncbi:GNAT family N-acetyltransferase [Nocardioides jensenii]|uniref:GNAT family N-acetyltransferase n=1 Tax=Nocardioides jensenii TaxID=1843 RepID=UPI00082F0322|nr:GNAT family N-acetyltransferase [Nocardioides jensenii]
MIREATAEDWAEIWPILEAVVHEGDTYAYPTDLTSDQGRALWLEPPPGRTVVLEEEGRILGTAKMGPNRPSGGAHIGTASFMVSDAARGHGVGRQLGEHVITWHRRLGFRGIQFNAVVESNIAAVNLWSDLGFEIIGTVPGAFHSRSHGYVGLHVMFLDLTS